MEGSDLLKKIKKLILAILGMALIYLGAKFDNLYVPISLAFIMISMAFLFIKFEKRKIEAEEMVIISVLSALAAVSRVPFSSLPSVQPTSFFIIVTGLIFGSETGFLVGTSSALISNFFMGQGPWTPWQMFAWGLMGYTAGIIGRYEKARSKKSVLAFGFIWGFLFGWIMNLWFVIGFMKEVTLKAFMTYYAASFYFDLAHALSNIFFISIFRERVEKILKRAKFRYGILQDK